MNPTRRRLLEAAGAAALAGATAGLGEAAVDLPGPRAEGADTPKICLDAAAGGAAAATPDETARRIRQLGVEWVISGGMRIPWEESRLRELMDRLKTSGLYLGNVMIAGFGNAIYARPGRDEDIDKVIQSVRAAGRAGLPVVEYNWYAHRAVEGYFEETGRAGAGWTGFDFEHPVDVEGVKVPFKDLPPLAAEGAHTLEEMWASLTYFLKAVIPEAEKAGVRLALHPNDPPAPISRGSEQIMATVEGWKRLIEIVDSPANGITFDCGVTREMGHDPVEVCHYFGTRDRINHVHFRNVQVRQPYRRYSEVFLDEGQINMFAVMRELVRLKYTRLIYPEHPRGLDYDRERPGFRSQYPGGGGYAAFAFNVGFTRAMLEAALNG